MESLMLQIYNNLGRLPNKKTENLQNDRHFASFLIYQVYLIPLSLSALEYFAAFCRCS